LAAPGAEERRHTAWPPNFTPFLAALCRQSVARRRVTDLITQFWNRLQEDGESCSTDALIAPAFCCWNDRAPRGDGDMPLAIDPVPVPIGTQTLVKRAFAP